MKGPGQSARTVCISECVCTNGKRMLIVQPRVYRLQRTHKPVPHGRGAGRLQSRSAAFCLFLTFTSNSDPLSLDE